MAGRWPLSLWLVGCGHMGKALLQGWLNAGLPPQHITVIEPNRPEALPDGVRWFSEAARINHGTAAPEAILFAVKPQMMAAIAPDYRPYVAATTLILSIAAGTPIAFFEQLFAANQPVIRTMPNLPATVGAGMTALIANPAAGEGHKALAEHLFEAAGKTAWLADEAQMHAVTALSGSGPAYVFLLTEVMAEAGKKAGLPAELAEQLARQTVIGAAQLMRERCDNATTLRQNVTSPGGTTQAALDILMGDAKLSHLFNDAILSALQRSISLSK